MLKQAAEQIQTRFSERDVEIPIGEIEKRLDTLVNKYRVPENEARRSVTNYFLKEHNIPRGSMFSDQTTKDVKVKDVNTEGQWINLRAKVLQLWESESDAISQVGLIGDETGNMRFVAWSKAELPKVEEGKAYVFKNVVTDEWQERYSVKLNRTTEIVPLDEDIETTMPPAGENPTVKISDIDTEGQWINLKAKIVQLWESEHESIAQVGLLGDETGTMKFTKWASTELPELVEEQAYLFKTLVTDEWQGRYSVKLNKATEIENLKEDIEVQSTEMEMTGVLVDIQQGSGLIRRCPQCNRVLVKGTCGEHGKTEGEYDLRIKAVLDDGVIAQDVLLDQERTEALTSITLEKAKEMAAETLDPLVVQDELKRMLVGRYFQVQGPGVGRYILVDTMQPIEAAPWNINDIISEMEAI